MEAEEGKFINIEFEVLNNSTETARIFDLKVIDGEARTFTICVEAYSVLPPFAEDACTLAELIPGAKRTFSTTFDVATDSEELVLEVTGLELPPQNKKYIDLDI